MPYILRKAPRRELYWVVAQDGSHKSIEPLPLERAKAQMRALYSREAGYPARRGRGGDEEVNEEKPILPISLPAPPFPVSVPEVEPYISKSDVKDIEYSGGSYYPEQYKTSPITIRKPTGWVSPAVLSLKKKRVIEKAMLDENTRRRAGIISRGTIV